MPKLSKEEKSHLKENFKKPPILPVFRRIFTLFFVLIISVAISATWYSWGYTWVYDSFTNSIPVLECPKFIMNLENTLIDGPLCEVTLNYNSTLREELNQYQNYIDDVFCSLPQREEPIVCKLQAPCLDTCWTADDGSFCPDPKTLPEIPYGQTGKQCYLDLNGLSVAANCKDVLAASYCDGDYKVTPSNEIAIRGIILASVIILALWCMAEGILRGVEIDLKKEVFLGAFRQKTVLPPKKMELETIINDQWSVEAEENKNNRLAGTSVYTGNTPRSYATLDDLARMKRKTADGSPFHLRSGDASPYVSGSAFTPRSTCAPSQASSSGRSTKSMLFSRDPRKRFKSSAWRRRLRQWRELNSKKGKTFTTRAAIRTFLVSCFIIISVIVTQYLILYFSPQHLQQNDGILSVITGTVSLWNCHTWLDILIFIDVILDVLMFFVACLVVKWPRAPVFTRHLQNEIEHTARELENKPDDDVQSGITSHSQISSLASEDTESLSFVLKQSLANDCCLMIACHESTITEERSETFANTLRSALMIFPPSHIFVCDNGGSLKPVDDIQHVTRFVHPDINYLYVPEGNKTFAFYWCTKYWIPFLVRNDRVPNFTYALMTDDDVPLPADLHIPHEHLRQNSNIKAVHFPITAASPNGDPKLIVRCQDIEYKMAAVHKLFQATLSRCLSCHGAIALWERETLETIFYDHDTVFHGEDMYMGLSLLRRRDDSKIISSAQAIVPTYAPDTWGVLFRQRVKSWDLTSHKKTFTYLYEILSPPSFCHGASLVLKPYFLQEFLTVLLDWLRIFLLSGLLLRDWIGLLLMTGIFTVILYIQIAVFQIAVLRQRRELRCTFGTYLAFPWYRLSNLVFRACALLQNVLEYAHDRKNVKIGIREDEIRDIPPCPPHPVVNWFNVWNAPIEETA